MLKWTVSICFIWFYGAFAQDVLHLYSWWGMFPKELIQAFEQETGIKVINDSMDTNEVLEAKLLAGRTNYDLVTPSFLPYGARQIQGGLYQSLDPAKIPALKKIDPILLKAMSPMDPNNAHAIPIVWGSVGLAYDEKKLKALYPQAPFNSWRLLFDPDVVKHFSSCPVTILEEAADVLIPALLGFGMLPSYKDTSHLKQLTEKLLDVRPYINRFDSIRSAEDLISGSLCLAMQWTGGIEHARHQREHPSKTSHIKNIIPEEGSVMWIDTLMMPIDAPHPKAAYAFIDFILRPENMAFITNKTYYANSVPESLPWISDIIKNHPALYPSKEVRKTLVLNTLDAPSITRSLNRVMTHFKKGKR